MRIYTVQHSAQQKGGGDVAVKYIYNPKTHTLHIKGYCHYTAYGYAGYLVFNSEAEALAYDGRAVGMCKLCEKKRTQQMQKGERK